MILHPTKFSRVQCFKEKDYLKLSLQKFIELYSK